MGRKISNCKGEAEVKDSGGVVLKIINPKIIKHNKGRTNFFNKGMIYFTLCSNDLEGGATRSFLDLNSGRKLFF